MAASDDRDSDGGAQRHPGDGGSDFDRQADEQAMAFYRQGEAARSAGRLEEAVNWYAKALLLDLSHRPSLQSLGAALTALGRDEEAQHALQRAAQGMRDDSTSGSLPRSCTDAVEPAVVPRTARPPASPGGAQTLIVPVPAEPQRADLYKRAMLLGGICFPAVPATYIVVGLATHFAPGLGAAALVALLLAALGCVFFPANRRLAFRGMLHGMLWGVGLVLLAALASIAIAVVRAVGA